MEHATAAASRTANITYHLVPVDYWEANGGQESYTPEAYAADGFIHLTNGTAELIKVANMFYTTDPREFIVLILDAGAIESEVRYEDEGQIYPHIYGPLNTSAVVGQLPVERADDGTFVRIGSVSL